MVFTAKGKRISVRRADGTTELLPSSDPFTALRDLLAQFKPVPVPGLPRFQGGAVGFLSYDMIRHVERLPTLTSDDQKLPDAVFMFTDSLLVFDNLRHRLLVIANAHIGKTDPASLDRAYDAAAVKIGMLIGNLRRPARSPPRSPCHRWSRWWPWATRDSPRRWTRPPSWTGCAGRRSSSPPATPTRWCCRAGWTPSSGPTRSRSIAPFGRSTRRPISSSCAWAGPASWARPRKCWSGSRTSGWRSGRSRGRIRAGRTEEEDARLADEMRADPKERAEHVMLVDLGRNDVGRVSRLGSVEVSEFMVVERYSHVMHLVSHVRGQLEPGKDAFDVLAACFPAGTLTGAPKIRAMEIIEELEPTRRGPYGGAVGYISYSGNLDSCITIRTVVCHGRRASIQVGAGIVADSDPKTEWLETASKARGMILALRIAAQEQPR